MDPAKQRPILSSMKPERVLLLLVAGIVVLAVVAGVVSALRPVSEFEPGTPEATVQAFLQAVFEGDEETAESYLASDSRCDASDIERARADDSSRVVLRESDIEDGRARVTVEIVSSRDGGPFDVDEYSRRRTFDLVQESGEWRLEEAPWPLFSCRGADG